MLRERRGSDAAVLPELRADIRYAYNASLNEGLVQHDLGWLTMLSIRRTFVAGVARRPGARVRARHHRALLVFTLAGAGC